MIDEGEVRAQIAEVLDPELDQSLSALGFVDGFEIRGAEVAVSLRLPTYWCAANFAYMMAADLRERIAQVTGVKTVTVRLLDHFAGDEISAGVNRGQQFSEVFPGDAEGELDELRRTFARKAFLIRQEQLLRGLLRAGYTPEQLTRMTAADLHAEDDVLLVRGDARPEIHAEPVWRRLPYLGRTYALWRKKRLAVGLGQPGAGPLFTTAEGGPLAAEGLMEHLRSARMIRLNGTFNTILCTGLYQVRYGASAGDAQELARNALCE